MPKSGLPLSSEGAREHPMGLAIEARHGWQVGGLDGSAPAWVGFGTSFLASLGGAERKSFVLDYGIFVRHALFPGERLRGFLGYGLGAAQAFVREVDGRGIGHLTALSLGLDVRMHGAAHLSVELSYRFVIIPSFETALEPARRYDFHDLRLSLGFFYGG